MKISQNHVIILCFKGKNISLRFYYVLIEWKKMVAVSLKAKWEAGYPKVSVENIWGFLLHT